jgi:hypothetical protein
MSAMAGMDAASTNDGVRRESACVNSMVVVLHHDNCTFYAPS